MINAWSKSKVGGAQGAERVLRTMEQQDDAGRKHLKPNNVTYNSVIVAWAKSGEGKARLRAE